MNKSLPEPEKLHMAGMTLPLNLRRGQVLRLMRKLNVGTRCVFDKWTKGPQPLLPDVRPAGSGWALYRRSDVLRAIQPGDGRLP